MKLSIHEQNLIISLQRRSANLYKLADRYRTHPSGINFGQAKLAIMLQEEAADDSSVARKLLGVQ